MSELFCLQAIPEFPKRVDTQNEILHVSSYFRYSSLWWWQCPGHKKLTCHNNHFLVPFSWLLRGKTKEKRINQSLALKSHSIFCLCLTDTKMTQNCHQVITRWCTSGPMHARASNLYTIKIAKMEGIIARFPNKNLGRVFTRSRVMKRTLALNLFYYIPVIRSWPIRILKMILKQCKYCIELSKLDLLSPGSYRASSPL